MKRLIPTSACIASILVLCRYMAFLVCAHDARCRQGTAAKIRWPLGFSFVVLAPHAFATFISSQDNFLLDVDFSLSVPLERISQAQAIEFDEFGDGWDVLVGVQLRDGGGVSPGVNGNTLIFFGGATHEVQGEARGFTAINAPIRNGIAGDTQNTWPSGMAELFVTHSAGEDVYEYLLSIASVDESVIGMLSMTGNLMFSGRHVGPPVSSVPEPSSLALVGIGLLGIGWLRRRAPSRGVRGSRG